jgi:hypothetical protein
VKISEGLKNTCLNLFIAFRCNWHLTQISKYNQILLSGGAVFYFFAAVSTFHSKGSRIKSIIYAFNL